MKSNLLIFLALLFSITVYSQSLEDGLIAKYTFDKIHYQNDKFLDITDDNNDISGYSLSFFDDDVNGNSNSAIATAYPVSTSYMELNENKDKQVINDLTSFTMSFWTIHGSLGNVEGKSIVLNIEDIFGTGYNLELDRQTSTLQFSNFANGQINASVNSITPIYAHDWHHISLKVDYIENKISIYVNGQLEDEVELITVETPIEPTITFGRYRNGDYSVSSTCFDNMYIHNRGLTNDEVIMTLGVSFTNIENNILTSEEATVFPNPAKDVSFLNIEIPNPTSKTLVDINDAQGRLMRTEVLTNNQINIAQLSKGVYFLKIKTQEGSYLKKVLIE